MPESDKLLALSNYFGVSLDYLLKDGAPDAAPAEAQEEHRTMRLLSLILCFGGAAALIVYGVLSILVPSVPAQISGYEIQYARKTSFAKAGIVRVDASRRAAKILDLKGEKNYYVRVRTYKNVGKIRVYSKWSAVWQIKTKAAASA